MAAEKKFVPGKGMVPAGKGEVGKKGAVPPAKGKGAMPPAKGKGAVPPAKGKPMPPKKK